MSTRIQTELRHSKRDERWRELRCVCVGGEASQPREPKVSQAREIRRARDPRKGEPKEHVAKMSGLYRKKREAGRRESWSLEQELRSRDGKTRDDTGIA